MKNKPVYTLGSVDNALLLLHMLRDRGELKVTEVAKELGIARSTAHRLLAMLVYRGFAVRDQNHTYLPGAFLSSGGPGGSTFQRLREIAQPHMETLCRQVQETVNLVVRVGTEIRFLSSVESSRLLHVADRRGSTLPANLAAGGRAMLAELPAARLREAFPDLTEPERAALAWELDEVRARGYGLNAEDTDPGVATIAAAVHDGRGVAVAAMSLSLPSARFDPGRAVTLVQDLHRSILDVERALADLPDL